MKLGKDWPDGVAFVTMARDKVCLPSRPPLSIQKAERHRPVLRGLTYPARRQKWGDRQGVVIQKNCSLLSHRQFEMQKQESLGILFHVWAPRRPNVRKCRHRVLH